MPSQAELQELLDKKEIEEVVGARYARALDWLDEEMLKTCFHEDGFVDYGFFSGNAHEWCKTTMPIEKKSVRRWHNVGNVRVEVNGAKAEAESYSFSAATTETKDGKAFDTLFGGRYLDTLEKRDGAWKISRRQFILDWMQNLPAGAVKGSKILGNLPLSTGYDAQHKCYRPMGPKK